MLCYMMIRTDALREPGARYCDDAREQRYVERVTMPLTLLCCCCRHVAAMLLLTALPRHVACPCARRRHDYAATLTR